MHLNASFVRILLLLAALIPVSLRAQADLADLRSVAERRASDWLKLQADLENKLARLLPCDPGARTLIDAAARASGTRLDAWAKYAGEWNRQTADELRRAKQSSLQMTSASSAIPVEAAQVQSMLIELRARRAALPASSDAGRVLDDLITLNTARLANFTNRAAQLLAVSPMVADLLAAAEAKASAVAQEVEQSTAQAARWREYYAARLSRAKTECTITGKGVAPARPARKKQ